MKDLKHLFTLERLLDDVDNELVRQATEDGRKCIGNICFQTPEVLMDLPGTPLFQKGRDTDRIRQFLLS